MVNGLKLFVGLNDYWSEECLNNWDGKGTTGRVYSVWNGNYEGFAINGDDDAKKTQERDDKGDSGRH